MRRCLVAFVIVGSFLGAAPGAEAYIYWSSYDSGNSRIGRADLDGTNANGALVTGIYFGAGVATDGTHVYWGESGSSPKMAAIGRAALDGTGANHSFQSGATFCSVFALRANATDIYWLKSDCSGGTINTRINRAANTGSQPYTEPGAGSSICGFAIDASYVYWSEGHYIARAPLTVAPPDKTWLDVGAGVFPCGVAVDAGHVYWANGPTVPGAVRGTTIGRASIDGSEASVDNQFITGLTLFAGGASPSSVAVDKNFVYWTNAPGVGLVTGSIGRASLDGTGVNPNFVPGVFDPFAVDVDAAGPPPAPPGGPPPGSTPPPVVPPFVLPVVVGVAVSNRTFAVGSVSTPLRGRTAAARGRQRIPRGTVFGFRLNRAASVRIAVNRIGAGRRSAGRCRKPTPALRRKPACDLTVATLFRAARSGANKVPFTGRIKGAALPPGSYRAVFTATGSGKVSRRVTVAFRIVKP